MLYELKDKRELSGDEHTIEELRNLRDAVSRYYEERAVIHGLPDSDEWGILEDRLIDVCFTGIVGDFRLYPDEWEILIKSCLLVS